MICHSGRSKIERGFLKAHISNAGCRVSGSTLVANMGAAGLNSQTWARKST
jgi:hypothetical protein